MPPLRASGPLDVGGQQRQTRKECGCCGYRGFVILRKLDADGARDTVRAMHEWAVRDWKQGKRPPLRLMFGERQ